MSHGKQAKQYSRRLPNPDVYAVPIYTELAGVKGSGGGKDAFIGFCFVLAEGDLFLGFNFHHPCSGESGYVVAPGSKFPEHIAELIDAMGLSPAGAGEKFRLLSPAHMRHDFMLDEVDVTIERIIRNQLAKGEVGPPFHPGNRVSP